MESLWSIGHGVERASSGSRSSKQNRLHVPSDLSKEIRWRFNRFVSHAHDVVTLKTLLNHSALTYPSADQLRRLVRFTVLTRYPRSCLSWPDSLVQTDSYRVQRVDFAIKSGLEVSMSSEWLFDKATPPTLGPQLQSAEVLNVFGTEEHVADSDHLLVDLVRMSSQDHALGNDALCRRR